MSAHTPGVWSFDGVAVFATGDKPIAEPVALRGVTTEERHANGHLIAAAPDLLAACEEVKRIADAAEAIWQAGEEKSLSSGGWCSKLAALRDVVGLAIAKARGP